MLDTITTPALRQRLKDHGNDVEPKYFGNKHFWTEKEIQILIDTYPTAGPAVCLARLPRHRRNTIYQKAAALGLKAPKSKPRKQHRHLQTAYVDGLIKEAWPVIAHKGGVQKLTNWLSDKLREEVPRFFVSRRALALGLTMAHKKEPPWTKEEIALLRSIELNNLEVARRKFREHGFARSATAIGVKARRLKVSRRLRHVLSKNQIAKILGVDAHWADRRIADGLLKAELRGTKRTAQQGGDTYSVTRADFRQFIIDHIDSIDIRKVDKFAFVAVLTKGG